MNNEITCEGLKDMISKGNWNFIDENIIWKALDYTPADEDAAKILAYAASLNLPGSMKCAVYKNKDGYILFEESQNTYIRDDNYELIETYTGTDQDILGCIEVVSDWDRAASDEELEIVDCLDPRCPENWIEYMKKWVDKKVIVDWNEIEEDLESRRNLMRHIIRALLIKDFIDEI